MKHILFDRTEIPCREYGICRLMSVVALVVVSVLFSGCALFSRNDPVPPWETQNAAYDNPILIRGNNNPESTWETIVDVVDDYFPIESQKPVYEVCGVLTEGRIDTLPQPGATIFEPWYKDSVGTDERLESTLQPLQRRAIIRVVPVPEGYLVEVSVFKELEDVATPDNALTGVATLRFDTSQTRIANPTPSVPTHAGWVPQGRDRLLEERILKHIQDRFYPVR